ncbi:ribonuclease III [Stappia sp.]|jgi:ribonuclease-3|uniref:ribonuclease III n=1 Tax=Stappia sp. TaxID=1870903 RepID=UPI003A992BCE
MTSHTRQKKAQAELQDRLRHRFDDPMLLTRALTHGSATAKNNAPDASYQRLEFLGDRVLGLAIATMLHHAFPKADEGELARRLNQLVRRETCADVARELALGEALVLGESEEQTGGKRKTAILADVCEAVIAAVYLDGGLEAAQTLIERHWGGRMTSYAGPLRDPKTMLQEWAQGRGKPAPRYTMTDRSGPDHAPLFTVKVEIDGEDVASGSGGSKRIAEQRAAETVLKREGLLTETDKT